MCSNIFPVKHARKMNLVCRFIRATQRLVQRRSRCRNAQHPPATGHNFIPIAFRSRLQHFRAGEPISARPVPAWERTIKWTRRHPTRAALACVSAAVVAGTFLGDTGAYFGGKLFGRRLLAPEISPHKTVEGLFCGMFVSVVAVFVFAAFTLDVAALRGDVAQIRLLLARGADVDSRDAARRTPLHVAALAGNAEAIQELLRHGAAVNALATRGRTPLYLAAAAGRHVRSRAAGIAAVGNVLTRLAYRNRGMATSVTSAVTEAALEEHRDVVLNVRQDNKPEDPQKWLR